MTKEKLIIEGMTCQHCVMAVKKDLQMAGVEVISAGIGFAEINLDETKISSDALGNVVSECGYKLTEIQKLG